MIENQMLATLMLFLEIRVCIIFTIKFLDSFNMVNLINREK